MKKSNFQKDVRYVYGVEYGTDDTISKVLYYRWDNDEHGFIRCSLERCRFARQLLDKKFLAKAGIINDDSFEKDIDIIAYKQNGDVWIKTVSDDTKKNNLEFLELARKYWG